MKWPLARLLCALAVLVTPAARADVSFDYSWNIDNVSFNVIGPGPISLSYALSPDGTLTVNHGNGSVFFTIAPGGTASAPAGGNPALYVPGVIPVGSMGSAAFAGVPAGIFNFYASFDLTLHLTDLGSGESGDLPQLGFITGVVSPDGTELGTSVFGYGSDSLDLGGHTYRAMSTVLSIPVPPPGADPALFPMSIYVDTTAGLATIPYVPEPSPLALAASALWVFGLAAARRRVSRP